MSWTGSETVFSLTHDQFELPKVFAIRAFTLLAVGALVWAYATGRATWRKSRLDYVAAGFLLWVLLTTLVSVYPGQSVVGTYWRYEGLPTFANYVLVFLLARQLVDSSSRVRSLASTLVASGAVVSIYAVIQFLRVDPLVWLNFRIEPGRAFSTFGNPDMLAGFLIFPLVLSLALALTEPETRRRVLYWTATCLGALALLATFVRGAWIAALIAVALFGLLAMRLELRLQRRDLIFVALGVVVLAAAVISTFTSQNEATNVAARAKSMAQPDEGSMSTRLLIWQGALGSIAKRPFFGGGPDTFVLVFPESEPAAYVTGAGALNIPDNAHNYPLQIAATLGLPGLALLYGLFLAVVWQTGRWILRRGGSKGGDEEVEAPEALLYGAFWLASAGYLLHLMLGLSVPSSTVFLWLSLGVLTSPLSPAVTLKLPAGTRRIIAAAALPILALALAASAVPVLADYYFMNGVMRPYTAPAIAAREKAISLNPYSPYRMELAQVYKDMFQSQLLRQGKAAASRQEKQRVFDAAKNTICDEIEQNAVGYFPYLELSSLYNTGASELDPRYVGLAVRAAQAGVARAPAEPDLRYELVRSDAIQGKTARAVEGAKRLLAAHPRHANSHLLLGGVYQSQGLLSKARDEYRAALKIEASSSDGRAPWRVGSIRAGIAAIEASMNASR